jgi:hypothetical protein
MHGNIAWQAEDNYAEEIGIVEMLKSAMSPDSLKMRIRRRVNKLVDV